MTAPNSTKRLSPSAELMGSEFVLFDANTETATVRYPPSPNFASPRGAAQRDHLLARATSTAMPTAIPGAEA
ncbi:hypothetical protein [Pontixanthobacter sp.]|uniref:hypothetical protein n=1 Tax=Pontixanthobacter sp. TaxID=2792078 RepID=UPI003C7B7142